MSSPLSYLDRSSAERALDDLRALIDGDTLRTIRRERDAAIAAARQPDPDLSDQANQRRRVDVEQSANERVRAQLDDLDRQARQLADRVTRWADVQQEPTDPTSALLAETRQQRAWARVQPLLDSGRTSLGAALRGATDLDTVRAIRAELPAWLAAQSAVADGRGIMRAMEGRNGGAVRSELLDLADRRTAALTPGEAGQRLRARIALADVMTQVTAGTEAFRRELTGAGSPTATAFAVRDARASAEAAERWANGPDASDSTAASGGATGAA